MTPDQKTLRVRELYETFARRDIAAVRDFLADDVVWYEPSHDEHSGVYRGPDEVMQGVLTKVRQGWTDFSADVHDVLSNDAHTVALSNWRGTSVANGQVYTGHSVLVAHVDDTGKLAEVWVIWGDPDELQAAHQAVTP